MSILKKNFSSLWFAYLFSVFSIFYMSESHSQEEKGNPIGSWMVLSMDNQLSEKWSVPVVGILCYENLTNQTEFGFVRTGLTYKAAPNLKLTLGTAYVDSQPLYHHEFETLTTQVWLYEQVTLKTGAFNHRVRLEHRWINRPNKSAFNSRLRYRFEFKQRLGKNYYIKCSDEPFLSLSGLKMDENRLFLGLGRKIGKDAFFEIGYFKTHARSNHFDRLRVAFHIKTQFLKKSTGQVALSNIKNSSK